ncbi:hypothetical protein [Arthrobacter sp. V1I9]
MCHPCNTHFSGRCRDADPENRRRAVVVRGDQEGRTVG